MASPTWWTWVWVDSGSWWWTGRPGVLRFMGSQRVRHDWATELTECLQSPHVQKGSSEPTYDRCPHLLSLDWDTPAFTSLPWLCSLVALLVKFYYVNLAKNLITESISDIFNWVAMLPSGSVGKESACTARAAGSVSSSPGLWRSPGNGNPLWSSCLGSPMDRGAWWATVHGVTKRRTRLKRLSVHTHNVLHGWIKWVNRMKADIIVRGNGWDAAWLSQEQSLWAGPWAEAVLKAQLVVKILGYSWAAEYGNQQSTEQPPKPRISEAVYSAFKQGRMHLSALENNLRGAFR